MPKDALLSGFHLADDRNNLYEIQRTNNFDLIVNFPDSFLRAGVDETAANREDNISGASGTSAIRLSVVKAFIPNYEQDIIRINRGNSVMTAAGKPKFSEGNIVVNDFIGINTKSVLQAWQRLSYDVTTDNIGRMSDYKLECILNEYTPNYELVRSWTIKGCWVSKISEDDFDMDSGDKKTITATIVFDRAIPKVE